MKSKCIVAFACWIILFAGSAHSQDESSSEERVYIQELESKLAEKARELKDLESLKQANLNSTKRPIAFSPYEPMPLTAPRDFQSSIAFAPASLNNFGLSYFDAESAKANNEINREISELIKQIRESETDEEKAELKNEIQQLLEKQYDGYLKQHEAPLQKLEERLEKLRADIELRKTAKEDLVKVQLDSIWYDALGLKWPGNSGLNSRGILRFPDRLNRPSNLAFPTPATGAPRGPNRFAPVPKSGQGGR